jgi:hypothetical protein
MRMSLPARHRQPLRAVLSWLLLASLLLRGLVPLGFMPGWDRAANEGKSAWLIVCPAGDLQALLANTGLHAHCEGRGRNGEHAGHRLHEAHLSCPFATAAAPGLPTAPADLCLVFEGLRTVARQSSPCLICALQRRLAPARAPPRFSLVR